MAPETILFGADYSVYVRIARMTLIEKGVGHRLVPVDAFSKDGLPDWYRAIHPFGKIPAFEHDGFRLFETAAIARYIDEAFEGPPLQPLRAPERAVMNQIIGMLDAYAYRTLVWDIYVERVARPRDGETSDEARIAAALPAAQRCLSALAKAKRPGQWLIGDQLSLADLHAAPMLAYFMEAPEGCDMLSEFGKLSAWWAKVSALASFEATRTAP
ncbi:MAG: glutathione S-transferase family protein [Aliihoeflea sp.]